MSVNIPKDPRPLDPNFSSPTTSSQPETAPLLPKDSLEVATTPDEISRHFAREGLIPELKTPQSDEISIAGAFRAWTETMRAFRDLLKASEEVNLEARRKFSQLAVEQAEEIAKISAQKEAALAKLKQQIEQSLESLQKKLDEMQELAKAQQETIKQLNSGNGLEKEKYKELTHAYDEYISKLKSIGAVDLGNGTFSIPNEPEEAKDQYNQFTQEYQQAVGKFNDYWKERSTQIQKYNALTAAYNQNVAEYNQGVNDFISQNHLSDYLKTKGIQIPLLSPAKNYDLAGYQEWIESPSFISTTPSSIFTFPLPSYARSLAQNGPSELPKLGTPSSFDTKILYNGMYQSLYASEIAPFDQAILQYTSYWSFIRRQTVNNSDNDSSDSLLNSKILTRQLLSPRSSPRSASSSSSSLAMQTMELGNSHLQTVLGQALLKEVIENAQLKSFEGLKKEEKEKKVEQLSDQILLRSIGLLGNQSIQALLPSLGLISDYLASLPKDSPAFAILFALSLSNRIQEDIRQGTTAEAIKPFYNANPALSLLTAEEKSKLTAALNVGQLLAAGKLLEETLGLKGLLACLFPQITASLDFNAIIRQAKEEEKQEHQEFHAHMKNRFKEQGYSDDQAHFLADIGQELTEQGLLAPSLTSSLSPKNLNIPLLENSIGAALVLAHYPLQEAKKLAQEAINHTLAEAPYSSTKQFRAALESQLSDFGIKNCPTIAASALFLSPTEKLTQLSPHDLLDILEKRTLQLLTPQLGAPLAQQISQEIAKTLFGKSHPDAREMSHISSPFAFVSVLEDQLAQLQVEHNPNWTSALTQTLKETLKTNESFHPLSLKIMDPAYLFVFAFGMTYGTQDKKKNIDIPS
jgi:hypothetical protein